MVCDDLAGRGGVYLDKADPSTRINHMVFADDLVLISESTAVCQDLLNRVVERLKGCGLVVNASKCQSITAATPSEA